MLGKDLSPICGWVRSLLICCRIDRRFRTSGDGIDCRWIAGGCRCGLVGLICRLCGGGRILGGGRICSWLME